MLREINEIIIYTIGKSWDAVPSNSVVKKSEGKRVEVYELVRKSSSDVLDASETGGIVIEINCERAIDLEPQR